MADWTAITGIVVSGVLGPGLGALYAAHRSKREHQRARAMADRAELRILLDEAEQAMLVGERVASTTPMVIATRQLHTAPAQLEELHEALREIDRQGGRLTLRLEKGDPATAAYRDAFNALLDVEKAMNPIDDDVALDPSHQAQMQSWVKSRYEVARAAHDAFLARAHQLVGSQLEPVGRLLRRSVRRLISKVRGWKGSDPSA